MRAQISTHDYEQISAYLDGQLSSREQVRFEQQVRERPDLKMALEEMSRTRALLRMAPHRHAPRNFTLTPAMVQQDKPKRSFGFNLFPALSFASALAALALVATVLFEQMPGVATNTISGVSPEAARMSETNAPMQQNAPETAATAASLNAASGRAAVPEGQANLPPIITWGLPPFADTYGGSAFGKGGGPVFDTMGRGGGSDLLGMGGGAPDGNIIIPYGSAESLPDASAAEDSTTLQDFDQIPTLEGAGPILGLPSADEAGQYTGTVPTPLSQRDLSTPADNGSASSESRAINGSNLRLIQMVLGGVALITGLAAFLIWRKTR